MYGFLISFLEGNEGWNFCIVGTHTLKPGSACSDLVTRDGGDTVISGHFDKKMRFYDIRSSKLVWDASFGEKITSLDLSYGE